MKTPKTSLKYLKKIAKYLDQNAELIIDLKYKEAIIHWYNKRSKKLVEFNIDLQLGIELSKCPVMQIDSANFETNREIYIIERFENKNEQAKALQQFRQLVRKFDSAYLKLTNEDFLAI